jgi:hypothetical protein
MERQHRKITIDDIEVNPRVVQAAFDNAKYQNKTYEVVSEVYRLINLSKIVEVHSDDKNTK